MTPSAWILVASVGGAAWMLWRRIGFNLSLTSVLIGLMILFHGPAYLYYTRVYGPRSDFFDVIVSAAKGHDVLPTLDLALALTFVFICVGVRFADFASRLSASRWRHALSMWARSPVATHPREIRRIVATCTALTIGLMLPFVLIDGQVPKVLNYFTSDIGEFAKIALRREEGGSSFYLYNLLLSNLLPFAAFCLIGLLFAKARVSRTQAIGFIVLVAFGKAATLSKAPLAVFALQCAIVWLMLNRLTLSWKIIVGISVLATGLFIVMSWVANPTTDDLILVLEFLFYRVFMIVNEGLLEYFTAIPYVIDHSWGAQSSWIAALFQSEPRLPTYWLVGAVHRGELGSTTTVMFMGDAWADFAWVGVILTAFLVGALTRWIDIQLIVKRGKTVASVAGIALGQYGLFIALSTSFQTALVTGGLAFVVPLVHFVSRRGNRRLRGSLQLPARIIGHDAKALSQ